MTVALDDVRDARLGEDLITQRDRRLRQAGVAADDDSGEVALFAFRAKDFLTAWTSAVAHLGLGDMCQTPYQNRHGGPSRDIQLNLRCLAEVQKRGHWKAPSSLRNYKKAGRLHKIVARVPRWIMEYGELCRSFFNAAGQRSF